MLYLVHRAEAQGTAFDSPLTPRGVMDSYALIDVLKGVVKVYVGPSIREIETIKPYKLQAVARTSVVRMHVEYDLYTFVNTPEKLPKALDLAYLQESGFNRQSVYGIKPTLETFSDFQTRVVHWFTNECLEQYKQSPVPTAVVADADVLSIIMYYLLAREPANEVEAAIAAMCECGSVFAFSGNGFGFDFQQVK